MMKVANETESFAELIYREGKLVKAICQNEGMDNDTALRLKAELNTIRRRIAEVEGAAKSGTPIWLM